MNIEKDKCFDELFCEHGVEEGQIQAAAQKYKFSEDKEFHAALQSNAAAFQAKVQQAMA